VPEGVAVCQGVAVCRVTGVEQGVRVRAVIRGQGAQQRPPPHHNTRKDPGTAPRPPSPPQPPSLTPSHTCPLPRKTRYPTISRSGGVKSEMPGCGGVVGMGGGDGSSGEQERVCGVNAQSKKR
jgi:hypothetical protein